jgi:hypothetical protein
MHMLFGISRERIGLPLLTYNYFSTRSFPMSLLFSLNFSPCGKDCFVQLGVFRWILSFFDSKSIEMWRVGVGGEQSVFMSLFCSSFCYCDCFENAQINAGITEFNKSKLALFKHNLLIEGWTDILLLFNCVLILIPCTLFSFTVTCIYLRVIMIHAYNFHSRSNKLSIYKTTMLHIIHGLDMISNDYEHYHYHVWVCLHFDVNVLF